MNITTKYKDILIILLLICIGVMGYQIHELRNDSISRFVNCFKPHSSLWEEKHAKFCEKTFAKLGILKKEEKDN